MVYFFTSREPEKQLIFMGKDKFENEDLIAYGYETDIWFHVDDLSSAHVYLRLNPGQTIKDISPGVLEDCLQLVKANSIQGSKEQSVAVVYTPWSNLKKLKSHEVGQVGFHDEKAVLKVKVVKKENSIVNRLEKTKQERFPNLKADFEAYHLQQRKKQNAEKEKARREELKRIEEKRKMENQKHYVDFMDEEKMTTNLAQPMNEDDFM